MNYALIRENDIANGPGVRTSLFVSGCRHHCKGCFNPDTWDFNGGEIFSRRVEYQFLELCKKEYIKNICILGGEPMDQPEDLLKLLKKVKETVPNKEIWLWTGYIYEDIVNSENEARKEILNVIDVLVDGPFIEELADKGLRYYGSTNQRVLNLNTLRKP